MVLSLDDGGHRRTMLIRRVDAKLVFQAIREDGVTHMCGAPIVYNMLINAAGKSNGGFGRKVSGFIAGSAPGFRHRGHGAHRLRSSPTCMA